MITEKEKNIGAGSTPQNDIPAEIVTAEKPCRTIRQITTGTVTVNMDAKPPPPTTGTDETLLPAPLRISVSDEFRTICPGFVGAVVEAEVRNGPTPPELWAEIDAFAQKFSQHHTPETLKQQPGIAATRAAYKKAGKDPSRYRPACEQLARRILQGKGLYSVSTLVDIGNLASLLCGYSTGAIDRKKIRGNEVTLGIGREEEEPYEAIGRGMLNIGHMPAYRDKDGSFATPTSDSVRTMLSDGTRHLAFFINGYDGDKERVAATARYVQELLGRYASSDGGSVTFY